MPTLFAINGLGRIGRALVRAAHGDPRLRLVAMNDLAPAERLAPLLRHDSVHGRFGVEVKATEGALIVGGQRVAVFGEREPGTVPWRGTGARVVVEATGAATRRELAAAHLGGEVKTVVVSAPAAGADATFCPGIRWSGYDPSAHRVVSASSCTTHCLALLVVVLHRRFGLKRAMMSEVHGYTADQRLVDGPHHRDPRRGRAAALNVAPTTTAAPALVESLLPELAGRLAGQAIRVPTPDVALVDLVAALARPAGPEEVNDAFRAAAAGELRGLLAVCDEPLVSSDYVGDPHSAVVDSALTASASGELLRVAAWYDNEWAYALRLAELVAAIGERFA